MIEIRPVLVGTTGHLDNRYRDLYINGRFLQRLLASAAGEFENLQTAASICLDNQAELSMRDAYITDLEQRLQACERATVPRLRALIDRLTPYVTSIETASDVLHWPGGGHKRGETCQVCELKAEAQAAGTVGSLTAIAAEKGGGA